MHDVPIPRLGGVGMLVGVLASLAVAAKLPLLHRIFTSGDEIRGVLTGALVICLVGVVDDVWGLDAITKLAGQVLAAGLMALQGVQLFWLPWPGRLIVLDATSGTLITVLAVVVTVNAVNFVDGLDGLAAGVVGIAAGAFFLFSYILAVQHDADHAATPLLLSAVLVGVCAGFLVHNFNPARIFMGDSGSMLIGLLLRQLLDHADRPGGLRVPRRARRGPAGVAAAAAAAGRARGAGRGPAAWPCCGGPGPAGPRSRRTRSTCTTGCSRSATPSGGRFSSCTAGPP